MKLLSTLFTFLIIGSFGFAQESSVNIPSLQRVEIDYPEYDVYRADLTNPNLSELEISVVSKETGAQVKGFGLSARGKATVSVASENKLVVFNSADASKKIKYTISPTERPEEKSQSDYRKFTLRNNSAKSIPLLIPSVMNPNLSPYSNSGVSLDIGQEIFFKANGRKQVLLVVDETIQNDEVIEVSSLIKERKRELGIH